MQFSADILIALGLTVVNLVWLALDLLALPGNWLMVGTTALVAWWRWGRGMLSGWTLGAILALAVLGELVEFLAGLVGARAGGAHRSSSLGAIVGAVLGAIIGVFLIPVPLVGSLLGACVGAFAMTYLLERGRGRRPRPALGAGLGAGVGQFLGTTAKISLGLVIWIVATVAAFWP